MSSSFLTWQFGAGSAKPPNTTAQTEFWHALPDGRLQCDVCPRACKLREGQSGLCFVRARQDHEIVLTTYGRSSGFCIDPVEKKPLYHFLPGTPVLSFGTAGCNLACKFCQNWDMSKSREMDTLADAASPAQLARAASESGCRSIAYTYNDPVIFLEYAIDVAEASREVGVKSIAVTAGYVCDEPRRRLFGAMDAANVDLKAFTEQFYHRICGGHLANVLDTLLYLHHETDVWLELTTLLIPGENDSPSEIEALSRWVIDNLGADVPIHFSAFHPDYRMLDKSPTPPTTLLQARDIARAHGIRHVYTGNMHNVASDSTYCAGCGERVITRDWYTLGGWSLNVDGGCTTCGESLAGVFEATPGTWGPKRQVVKMGAP